MEILLTEQFSEAILEMAATKRIAQEIDDFFEMLNARKNTFAYAYTANTMDSKLKKNIVNADGISEINPMFGKLYKVTTYKFNFGRTYREAVNRKNPAWDVQIKNGYSEKVQGYKMVYFNAKGDLMFPIADFTSKSRYFMVDDANNIQEYKLDELKPYMKPSSTVQRQSSSGVNYKNINVDKIYKFNAGGKTWNNRVFIYTELLPALK